MVVASFHLVRYRRAAAVRRVASVPFDRRSLARVPGLAFGRLLGTGRGQSMGLSADLRRWAMFAVWDDDTARVRFLERHPLARHWDGAEEAFHVSMEPIAAHGAWDGVDPIAGARAEGDDGPVAAVTRATVRWRQVPAFQRAVPEVDRHLRSADGLLAAVGVGELPIGRQATFSLWRDLDAMRAYAYSTPEHTDVVRRTREEGWYGEEWFARFRPLEWSGTWDGRRPLD